MHQPARPAPPHQHIRSAPQRIDDNSTDHCLPILTGTIDEDTRPIFFTEANGPGTDSLQMHFPDSKHRTALSSDHALVACRCPPLSECSEVCTPSLSGVWQEKWESLPVS